MYGNDGTVLQRQCRAVFKGQKRPGVGDREPVKPTSWPVGCDHALTFTAMRGATWQAGFRPDGKVHFVNVHKVNIAQVFKSQTSLTLGPFFGGRKRLNAHYT